MSVEATETLLVRGLDDEGPGDVVGAFANEAGIDPDAIGDIGIDGDEVTVEVDAGVAETVVDAMDGGRIGRSAVTVEVLDEATAAVEDYVREYRRLVDLEREAEMERHESEIRSLSGREREEKGRALLEMRGRDEGESIAGYEVKFVKPRGRELPDTEIGVGDLVMLSKRDPRRDDNPTGTVTGVTGHSVTVAFDGEPPGFVFGDGLRIDLYVNDVTYQRMADALERLRDADGALAALRDVIVGVDDPEPSTPAAVESFRDGGLNESQREAARAALGADRFHLIHGPPGTGKTTTAVEVIRQAIDRGESVLATAASNTAVDNVVEFLADRGVEVVRVGHPARVTDQLIEHTLDSRLEENETYRRSRDLREEAFEKLDERDEYTAPSGKWRRGLSDERIRELAAEGRGSRGVPPEKIEEMARWLDLQAEADHLFERSDELEREAVDEVLDAADVVCTTNSTAGSEALSGRTFDTLVLDEATQATEPSCLIPITRARRVVMAGDHRQLPPTVQSERAAREGLRETLFERLADRGGGRSLLETQYRMHAGIQAFPSERFYDGRLTADPSVREHTLAGLGIEAGDLPPDSRPVLDPAAPLVFTDTTGIDAPERQREGSTSRENPREAALVARLARDLLDAGLAPGDLAVISPYDDQVDRIEDLIDRPVEVDTVDGFQGREKEAVLVSLVRSNDRGEVGFLDEPRRFNVSLTRARRKAVVVGDADTVTAAPVYEAFLAAVRERGRAIDLAELDGA